MFVCVCVYVAYFCLFNLLLYIFEATHSSRDTEEGMSEPTRQKRRRGGVSAWAKSHFTTEAATTDAPAVTTKRSKYEKRIELDPATTWRCTRCGEALLLPTDPATQRPRYAALVEHLGSACRAGPLAPPDASVRDAPRPVAEEDRGALRALLRSCEAVPAGGRGRVFVVLQNPKTPANLGSILRAMDCFNVEAQTLCGVIYSGTRMGHALAGQPLHTDTTGAAARIPQLGVGSLQALFDVLREVEEQEKGKTATVAVDIIDGAAPLHLFRHPHSDADGGLVFYLFGAEDGSLSQAYLAQCQHAVYVCTRRSLNLAATVTVVLYDREAKHRTAVGDGGVFEARNGNNNLRWTPPPP